MLKKKKILAACLPIGKDGGNTKKKRNKKVSGPGQGAPRRRLRVRRRVCSIPWFAVLFWLCKLACPSLRDLPQHRLPRPVCLHFRPSLLFLDLLLLLLDLPPLSLVAPDSDACPLYRPDLCILGRIARNMEY